MIGIMNNKKKLLILGAGQYGQVLKEVARATGDYSRIGFLDDTPSDIALGSLKEYRTFAGQFSEAIVAIGNPEAKGISATSGIVCVDSEYITMTGADNSTEVTFRVLRTDCAINEGNSGGGLFNSSGELIGIVNAKTISNNVDNMGYAIPTVIAKNVADNILRNYNGEPVKVKKQTFGLTVRIKDSVSEYDELTNKVKITQVLEVSEISENSIAEASGLQVNDVIVSYTYNSKTENVTRMFHIIDVSLTVTENSVLTLNILRNGETLSINMLADSLSIVE